MVRGTGCYKVAVGLVEDEGDVAFVCELGEGRKQAVRIYRASLGVLGQRAGARAAVRRRTGLLGLHRTIAFVFGVISSAQRSGDGMKPSFAYVCSKTGLIPSIVRVILSGIPVSGGVPNVEQILTHD